MKKSKEFEEKNELEEQRHQNKMKELKYERETINHRLEEEMGMIRLKNANMNRMLDKKQHIKEQARKRYEERK